MRPTRYEGSDNVDIDLARQVVRTTLRSGSELQGLLGVLKRRCSPEEYDEYARSIAAAIDAIGVASINKISGGASAIERRNRAKHS